MNSGKMVLRLLLAGLLIANLPIYAASEETDEQTGQGVKSPKFSSNVDWSVAAGGSGRKLLQASVNAISFINEVTAGPASYCNLYTAANEPDTCPDSAPIPACCSGSTCYSNADGSSGFCKSGSPTAACCPAFNQNQNSCVYPDSNSLCSLASRPVPGCCSGGECAVNKNGDGGYCKAGQTAKCCPA